MTDRPAIDTWTSRDLPLLRHSCAILDSNERLLARDIDPSSIGMSEDDIVRALRALDGEYLLIKWFHPHPLLNKGDDVPRNQGVILGITGSARRAVGMWPTAETVTEQLLATLDEQIANTADQDKRSKLIKIRDAIGGAARDLFVDIVGSVATKMITGG
jgi:hypothetical protein